MSQHICAECGSGDMEMVESVQDQITLTMAPLWHYECNECGCTEAYGRWDNESDNADWRRTEFWL
jgi:hypothetical protein